MDCLHLGAVETAFAEEVAKASGQSIAACYSCGNCSAGCPVAKACPDPVGQVMRMVQLGMKDKALTAPAIWLCVSCEACTTRCPNNIDVARVVDVLRHMARREGRFSERRLATFADAFIDSVARHGRAHELEILMQYKAKTGALLDDIDLGPAMFLKGKLKLLPHAIAGKDEVADIVRRYREGKAQAGGDKA